MQAFIDEYDSRSSDEDAARANSELQSFWEKYVGDNAQKLALFMGVLKILRPAITGQANIVFWARKAVTLVSSTGSVPSAIQDAQAYLVGTMVFSDDEKNALQRSRTSARLCKDLFDAYMFRSSELANGSPSAAPSNAQIKKQIEDVLIAFGRRRPKDLFNSVDDLVLVAESRLQALTLLNNFLQQQTPHVYLVTNTPLVEHLLKCLTNDTSTIVLSVAMKSLIMLLPHIPGFLGPQLPRLFLIYTRLLCWERFSELSSEAQRATVTDSRISHDRETSAGSQDEATDIGIDFNWERARPHGETIEAGTPELMTFFSYLYALYPLNLMSYIRKPRRYLRDADFPNADAFDLDRGVMRSRTEQFRQMHLVHPNSYTMTVEEELTDPKWSKMDSADVVGLCQALCIFPRIPANSPLHRPVVHLPDPPPMPPLDGSASLKIPGPLSPAASFSSLRSGSSWRDTQSTAASLAQKLDSPVSKPQSPLSSRNDITSDPQSEFAKDEDEPAPQPNMASQQQQVTMLQNELAFERWQKAQYSEHISQIMRRNVKEATVDAETLNLINANRSLKKQIEQIQKAREATMKDAALTRKQANNLETHMIERFNRLKLEQETWQADADELRRLRTETKQYRDLLVTTEARDLNKSHQLQIARQDLDELDAVREQLQEATDRLRTYEDREFEVNTAMRERDILRRENEALHSRLQLDVSLADRPVAAANIIRSLKRRESDPQTLRPAPMLITPPQPNTRPQTARARAKTMTSKGLK